jgi:hypothetical protein
MDVNNNPADGLKAHLPELFFKKKRKLLFFAE